MLIRLLYIFQEIKLPCAQMTVHVRPCVYACVCTCVHACESYDGCGLSSVSLHHNGLCKILNETCELAAQCGSKPQLWLERFANPRIYGQMTLIAAVLLLFLFLFFSFFLSSWFFCFAASLLCVTLRPHFPHFFPHQFATLMWLIWCAEICDSNIKWCLYCCRAGLLTC